CPTGSASFTSRSTTSRIPSARSPRFNGFRKTSRLAVQSLLSQPRWMKSGRTGCSGWSNERSGDEGRSLAPQDTALDLGVRDAPRRARRAASAGLHRRQDDLALRRGGDRRSPRDAEGGWRLGGARQRGRAEAGQGGHRRGLGPLPRQPIGGWYGLKKGLRGRFGMYLP